MHIAMRVDELRALGMNEAEAVVEALRRFGDAEEYHDYVKHRAVGFVRVSLSRRRPASWKCCARAPSRLRTRKLRAGL